MGCGSSSAVIEGQTSTSPKTGETNISTTDNVGETNISTTDNVGGTNISTTDNVEDDDLTDYNDIKKKRREGRGDPDSGSISPASHPTSGEPPGGAHVRKRAYLAQVLPKQRKAIML